MHAETFTLRSPWGSGEVEWKHRIRTVPRNLASELHLGEQAGDGTIFRIWARGEELCR
jgi:hypothetical protein